MTTKEYFPGIGKIPFEGKESKNPMAFHYYNAEKVIRGKKMKDWLRFSMAWWHTLCAEGGDQFGGGTKRFPWNVASSPIQRAKDKMDAGFEFMQKCGIGYYCFHDIDLVEEADTIEAYEANLQEIVAYARKKQAETGIKLLWGTANVFGHARYMNGAATNPDFDVVARAAVQIKNALDATIALGGENYVFWGGREGYMSLLNSGTVDWEPEEPISTLKPGATLRIWKISSLHTLQEWMLLPERLKMQTACYANLPSAICSKHAMLLSIQAQEKHSKKVNFRWKICGNMRSLTENPNKPAVNKNYTKQ